MLLYSWLAGSSAFNTAYLGFDHETYFQVGKITSLLHDDIRPSFDGSQDGPELNL